MNKLIHLSAILLGCFTFSSGCSCGIAIVQKSDQTNANNQGGNKGDQTTPRPSRYQIRGVTMVAFYPGATASSKPNLDFSTGSMNGYAVFYNKPQETVITAWAMKDGECKFETISYDKIKPTDNELLGLDGGKELSFQIGKKNIRLEQRNNGTSPSSPNIIYNLPTASSYTFPYNQDVLFRSKGEAKLQAFQIALKSPAHVVVTQPKLKEKGILVPREKDFSVQWTTKGTMEYLAIRVNQNLQDKKETRSLFCRLANTGQATISTQYLKKFAPDTEGSFTSLYIVSTTNKLTQVPGLPDPVLSVVRATSTVPLQLK